MKEKAENEESWLFYCKKDSNVSHIASLVEMTSYKLVEVNCDLILNEETMWIDFIVKIDSNYSSNKKDLEGQQLSLLRQMGAVTLSSSLQNELLILIKNLPEDEKRFKLMMGYLTNLCEAVSVCWNEIEELGNPNLLGKVAVVFESNRKIDVLSIEKEDSKIVLYVEPLD